jgi:hypothetical protein
MYLINQKIQSQFEFLSRQIEHERRLITEQLNQVYLFIHNYYSHSINENV